MINFKFFEIWKLIKNLWNRDIKQTPSFSLQFKCKVIFKYFKLKFNKNSTYLGTFLKNKIYQITGFHISEISNAFATSSLILIIIKIFYWLIFNIQITFIYNLLLLLGFLGIALIYNIHFYLRFLTFKIIKNTFGDYFFGLLYYTWKDAKIEIEEKEKFIPRYQDEYDNVVKWPKRTWYNDFFVFFSTFLIQIRLFMMAEPFLFVFIRFLLFYWLIFNKFLILTYIISLIILSGRFLLLYQINDFPSFHKWIMEICNLEQKETIKPTFRNSFIILMYITTKIMMDKDENTYFFIMEKEPNLSSKYTYRMCKNVNGHIPELLCLYPKMLYWKLKNYDADINELNIINNKILTKIEKNTYFKNLVIICFILCVFFGFSRSIFEINLESTSMLPPSVGISLNKYKQIQLTPQTIQMLYKSKKYNNIDSRHFARGIFDKEQRTLFISYETTLRNSYKPLQYLKHYNNDKRHAVSAQVLKISNINTFEENLILNDNRTRDIDQSKQSDWESILNFSNIKNSDVFNKFLNDKSIREDFFDFYNYKTDQPVEIPVFLGLILDYPFQDFALNERDFYDYCNTLELVFSFFIKSNEFSNSEKEFLQVLYKQQKLIIENKTRIFELTEEFHQNLNQLSIVDFVPFQKVKLLTTNLMSNMSLHDSFHASQLEYKGFNYPIKVFKNPKNNSFGLIKNDIDSGPSAIIKKNDFEYKNRPKSIKSILDDDF